MDIARFRELVARLETLATQRPGIYRMRTVAAGALGYLYIFGVLGAILGVLAGAVWLVVIAGVRGGGITFLLKALIPLGGVAIVMLRSMWVTFETPTGIRITREEAPKLFELIDDLCRQLDAPGFHQVLLTREFNAAVSEVPRLGIFGWPRHYLLLGLPLLHGMTGPQFRAVLAHELGHRSRRHGRIGAWTYRVRATWAQLLTRLHEQNRGTVLFAKFFEWYSPWFDAYSFVLARIHERDADLTAAHLTSAKDLGDALCALEVKSRYFDAVLWPALQRRAENEPNAPQDAFAGISRTLTLPQPEFENRYLTAAMCLETGPADTHPALRDRLTLIGYAVQYDGKVARYPQPHVASAHAATAYLGDSFTAAKLREADASWHALVREGWVQVHANVVKRRERLREIQSLGDTIGPELVRERAYLVEELDGEKAATPYFRELVSANPDDPGLRFSLGRALMWELQDGAREHLEVASRNIDYAVPANACIAAMLRDAGEREEALKFMGRVEHHAELERAAQQERSVVGSDAVLLPHGLPESDVKVLVAVCRQESSVKRLFVARKKLRHRPESPLFVLFAVVRHGFFGWNRAAKNQEMANQLTQMISLPGSVLVFAQDGTSDPLFRAMKKLPGAEVYKR